MALDDVKHVEVYAIIKRVKFNPPQIRVGALSKRVLCITHGKEIDLPPGSDGKERKGVEASVKYDVHEQFEAVALELGWTPPED